MSRDDLESEIEAARLEIAADAVSMSITELSSLYKEGILQIRPEFQRLFRWTNEQKSRLVESVLLGIPLPSLFVSQAQDGSWELVDGLQRVSTLLELQGLLVGADGKVKPALILKPTKYLPNLEGRSWNGVDETIPLTSAQQLDIRLARLDLKVIKRTSDPKAKYDLFQRLNSFGSSLTAQEIRSALIAGASSECLAWLTHLSQYPGFLACVSLADRLIDEQYDLELILRFLMLYKLDAIKRSVLTDFPVKLDDWSVELASTFKLREQAMTEDFQKTFDYLALHGGEDLFRRWDDSKGQFRGAFLNTSYEVIALGVGYRLDRGLPVRVDLENVAKELSRAVAGARFSTGLATADRLVKTLPLGRRLLGPDPEPITAADLS